MTLRQAAGASATMAISEPATRPPESCPGWPWSRRAGSGGLQPAVGQRGGGESPRSIPGRDGGAALHDAGADDGVAEAGRASQHLLTERLERRCRCWASPSSRRAHPGLGELLGARAALAPPPAGASCRPAVAALLGPALLRPGGSPRSGHGGPPLPREALQQTGGVVSVLGENPGRRPRSFAEVALISSSSDQAALVAPRRQWSVTAGRQAAGRAHRVAGAVVLTKPDLQRRVEGDEPAQLHHVTWP